MRKWTRGRPGRRTPKPATPAEPMAAPLQPAYFESPQAETAEPQPSGEPAEEVASDPAGATAQPEPGNQRPRRRRRGRGGRSKRSGTPPPAADATSEVAPGEPESAAPAAEPASPSAQPSAGLQPATRAPKGVVVLAIGLPGSGKSSWFKRHNIRPLSSDLLRDLLFDDAREQRFQDLIFSNLRSLLKARLIARRPTNYVDATNLTPHERHNWIKLAKDFGYEVHAVFFDVPLEVCLERNRRRQRVVAEDVMRRMAGKLRAPSFDEGFAKITVVRVKQKMDSTVS